VKKAERTARIRRIPLTIYQLAVTVPTLGGLAYAIAADPHVFSHPVLLFWVAAIAVVDLMPVEITGGMELSLSFPIVLAVALLYSPEVAMAVALIGSFDRRELKRQLPLLKAMFIRSQVAVSVFVQASLFHAFASLQSPWYILAPAVLVAIAAGYIVNVLFVAVYMRLAEDMPIRVALARQRVGGPVEFMVSYIGLSLLGLVIGRLYVHDGLWSVAVFIAPLVFGRQMYFRSRALSDRLSEQNALLAEQARLLQTSLDREQHAVAEMRELNRMKSEFVAVASHELRTPLTTIIGYAKTLRQPQFSSDAVLRDEFLQTMERQGDRLLRLVENLLMTSNLESKQVTVSLVPLSVEGLLAECVESLGAGQRRITLDIGEDIPEIVTDRQMLGRIVSNLLDNALKYSPEDAYCEVGARGSGKLVEIWVADRGVGIPVEDLDRIFERFYQTDSSSTRAFGGVGLGLSLVRDLVASIAGTIAVKSEPGVGSRFTVTLPVRHPSAPLGSPPNGPVPVPALTARPRT
jgi:signal transduction histidine kinase